MEVNIHEAKIHLSRLLERVAIGQEVIITKAGKPVAKLVGIKRSAPNVRFKLGSAKGEFVVPDDFNDPLPKEIEDLFLEMKSLLDTTWSGTKLIRLALIHLLVAYLSNERKKTL